MTDTSQSDRRRELLEKARASRQTKVEAGQPLPEARPPRREPVLTRADKYTAERHEELGTRDRSPAGTVKLAKERLRRTSLSMVRRLEDLTEEALNSGHVCTKCGCHERRDEELRLKAINSALDRAGVAAGRGASDDEAGETGPVLIFPPGTRLMVAAAPPADAPPMLDAGATTDAGPTLVRGDLR